MKAKIRLTIEVDYETNGTPIATLKDSLEYVVRLASGSGWLIEDTTARSRPGTTLWSICHE